MKLATIQKIALFLFFFSINFEVWDPLNTGYFSIAKFTGLLYFTTLIPELQYFMRTKRIKRFLSPLWIFFGILTIVNFININFVSAGIFDFSIFQNFVLLILMVNHSRKEPGILERGMLAYAFGSAIFAILFYLGIGREESIGGRIRMFGDNENVIGIRMCISMIYLLFLIIQNPLKLNNKKFLLLIPIPIMFSLLLATGSRLGFISFALCFTTGMFLIKTKRVYIKIIILVVGLLIGSYIWSYVLSTGTLYERLLNSAQSEDLSGRDEIWKSIFPLIRHNPVLGVGTTGYDLYCYTTFGRFVSPHNVILEILCYTGTAGLLAYLYFFYRVARISYSKYRFNGSIIQLLLLIPILGSILSGQILLTKIGWVLYAFIIGRSSVFRVFKKSGKLQKHIAVSQY